MKRKTELQTNTLWAESLCRWNLEVGGPLLLVSLHAGRGDVQPKRTGSISSSYVHPTGQAANLHVWTLEDVHPSIFFRLIGPHTLTHTYLKFVGFGGPRLLGAQRTGTRYVPASLSKKRKKKVLAFHSEKKGYVTAQIYLAF